MPKQTEPFPTPFQSDVTPVKDEWVDYNGHMNVAYYLVLFDQCVDQAFNAVGLGPDYLKRENASFFTVEVHINYLQELAPKAPTLVTLQFLEADEKRVRAYLELYHAEEGFLAATCEQLFLHVDMSARRAAPFPERIQSQLESAVAAHADLPWPKQAGRAISMKKSKMKNQ